MVYSQKTYKDKNDAKKKSSIASLFDCFIVSQCTITFSIESLPHGCFLFSMIRHFSGIYEGGK